MRPTTIGVWTTPAGNAVEAVLEGEGRFRDLVFLWNDLPLSDGDRLELLGPTFVVRA